jgi:uncharacterized membrane protein YbaN (DUF454 family)
MAIGVGRIEIRRGVFASLGVLCVALGIVGIFVPGLPATEFILAASYLFSRSSPALEGWLERHRWLGPLLRHFRETGAMPRKAKVFALVSMWTGLGISLHALAALGSGVQLAMFTMGVVGTVTILFFVRTTAGRQPLILS